MIFHMTEEPFCQGHQECTFTSPSKCILNVQGHHRTMLLRLPCCNHHNACSINPDRLLLNPKRTLLTVPLCFPMTSPAPRFFPLYPAYKADGTRRIQGVFWEVTSSALWLDFFDQADVINLEKLGSFIWLS